MRLTVAGSGDAFCAAGALQSTYVVEHSGGTLLLECGATALAGLKRASIPTETVDTVLVSHLHGDRFGGIPFLILEYTFANVRTRPLRVIGPPSIEERVYGLYEHLYKGIPRCEKFEARFEEIVPGDRFEVEGLAATAFEVPHNADPFSLGYRLDSDEGNMLFSGDSAWTEEFVARSEGTDLFLCECCSMEPSAPLHLSYSELLARRASLGCSRMVLTHLGEDVRRAEGLELERAEDGMVIEIG